MPFGDIVAGSDGDLWFSDIGTTKAIGRIDPSGQITEFSAGLNSGAVPENLVLGSDGNVWFLDLGSTPAIGRVTPAGVITEFSSGLNPMSQPNAITLGPDKNVWFTDQGNTKAIGRVTPAGVITEFSAGLDQLDSFPDDLTAAADGNVWFTDTLLPAIGRGNARGRDHRVRVGLNHGAAPDTIVGGADGNVWFADQNSHQYAIGRVTPAGMISEFSAGLSASLPDDITPGNDGNLWVPQSMSAGVARITPSGQITEFTQGLNSGSGSDADQIVSGPDGNLWFTDDGTPNAIGKVPLQVAPVVTTGAASGVTASSATVTGTVNPSGAAAAVSFQYGTTMALGSTLTVSALGAGEAAQGVSGSLSGLPAAATIYYQLTATNASGTTSGAVKSFTTAPSATTTTSTTTTSTTRTSTTTSTTTSVSTSVSTTSTTTSTTTAITTTSTTGPPVEPQLVSTTATIGNQQLVLLTPSPQACTARARTLGARLSSNTLNNSRDPEASFANAAFYIDRGIPHIRRVTKRMPNGRKRTVTVTVYSPNAIIRRVPVAVGLRLSGLRSGTHSLTVRASYTEALMNHGRRTKVITKVLRTKFRVC